MNNSLWQIIAKMMKALPTQDFNNQNGMKYQSIIILRANIWMKQN